MLMMLALRRFQRLTQLILPATEAGDAGSSPLNLGPQLMLMMLALRRFPRLTLVILPATEAGDAGSSPLNFGGMRTRPTADAHDAGPAPVPIADASDSACNLCW
eukprot:s6026_g5.t1